MYHSRIVLSVGGSVWYMIRNLRCTVTIDSVLANSKTYNAFLFTVNAIFLHDYPTAVEPGSTPRPLVQKKLGEILYLLICSFLPCLSWLLRSRVWRSRRDLWITLYIIFHFIWDNKTNCRTLNIKIQIQPVEEGMQKHEVCDDATLKNVAGFVLVGQFWIFWFLAKYRLPKQQHFKNGKGTLVMQCAWMWITSVTSSVSLPLVYTYCILNVWLKQGHIASYEGSQTQTLDIYSSLYVDTIP